MSGQWEVVGKKREKSNKQISKKVVKETKKKQIANSPKIEDVLPMSQVRNLYKSKDNKENQKPQEKKVVQENGAKKPTKKLEKQDSPKPKPPKSIESALNSIAVEDFKQVYDKTKTLFPDAPVVWLKELAQYLNQKIPVDVLDPVFSSKQDGYPLSSVPAALRSVMEKSVKEAGPENAQLFFDISLTVMATDMSKGFSAIGHKLYLQYLATSDPKLASQNLGKHSVLRNSYQNRQNIGLSILWALGQCGLKDFSAGFKVFQEIMLPLIEMKNYSRYIVKYLMDLVNRHSKSSITRDQYLLVLDNIVFSNKKNFPNDLAKDLNNMLPKLKSLLLSEGSNEKHHTFVDPMLKKLQTISNKSFRNEICDVLVTSLHKDQTSFSAWNKCYGKNLSSSGILLSHIESNWKSISAKLNRKTFAEMLNGFASTNEELLLKKRKDDGLLDCVAAIQKLNNKMVAKKGSGFPYKTVSFMLIAFSTAVVVYDIKQSGSWGKSQTSTVLHDSGVKEYMQKTYERALLGVAHLNKYAEDNFPEYYQTVVVFIEPYVQLSKDLGLVIYNFVVRANETFNEKYPLIIDSIEAYAPGLLEHSQKAVQNVVSTSSFYFNRSVNYLTNEVFVGQLAPQNMQRVVLEAFNTTQELASKYYHWLYEKVQTTIK